MTRKAGSFSSTSVKPFSHEKVGTHRFLVAGLAHWWGFDPTPDSLNGYSIAPRQKRPGQPGGTGGQRAAERQPGNWLTQRQLFHHPAPQRCLDQTRWRHPGLPGSPGSDLHPPSLVQRTSDCQTDRVD